MPSVPGVDRYLDDGLSAHYTVAARAGDVDVSLELGCLVRMQSVPADPYQVLFCADRTRSRNHGG